MNPNSRYQDIESVVVMSHDYDELGIVTQHEDNPDTDVVHARLATYRLTTLPLPDPPTTQYMAKTTDTWPVMAKRALNDSTLWWVLAEANPQVRHPFDLATADLIYIPS